MVHEGKHILIHNKATMTGKGSRVELGVYKSILVVSTEIIGLLFKPCRPSQIKMAILSI
jgi:hypothetical protein